MAFYERGLNQREVSNTTLTMKTNQTIGNPETGGTLESENVKNITKGEKSKIQILKIKKIASSIRNQSRIIYKHILDVFKTAKCQKHDQDYFSRAKLPRIWALVYFSLYSGL